MHIEEVLRAEAVYDRCGGLDIHKRSLTACVLARGWKEVCTLPTAGTRGWGALART